MCIEYKLKLIKGLTQHHARILYDIAKSYTLETGVIETRRHEQEMYESAMKIMNEECTEC
jgi:hypothetical protein